jgi:hypothetical protein
VLNEFYRVAFRKKVYRSIDELQADLDSWIKDQFPTARDARHRRGELAPSAAVRHRDHPRPD